MRDIMLVAALLLSSVGAHAQSPAPAVSATCKDGTAFSGPSRRGACSGHGGVEAFGTSATVAPNVTTPPPASSPPTAAPAAPASTRSQATTPQAVPGGGAGQVWVNSATKVYHCSGDRYYGKTKAGSYMTESAAKAEGDRPSRGKVCT